MDNLILAAIMAASAPADEASTPLIFGTDDCQISIEMVDFSELAEFASKWVYDCEADVG